VRNEHIQLKNFSVQNYTQKKLKSKGDKMKNVAMEDVINAITQMDKELEITIKKDMLTMKSELKRTSAIIKDKNFINALIECSLFMGYAKRIKDIKNGKCN